MPLILAIETATKLCSVALGRDGQLLALREIDPSVGKPLEGKPEKLAHAEKVNVFIAEVMEEAGLPLKDLDAVAVGIGPGSYTGLRIGLSAAKGLCYALDKPIIGLSTLGTLVQAALQRHGPFTGTPWPMIDARRMEVFAQPYSATGQPLGEAAPLILDDAWAQLPTSQPLLLRPTSAGRFTRSDNLSTCHPDEGRGQPLNPLTSQRVVFGDGADKAAELWVRHPDITHLAGIRPSAAAMLLGATERFSAGSFDDLAYLVPDYGKGANVSQPPLK